MTCFPERVIWKGGKMGAQKGRSALFFKKNGGLFAGGDVEPSAHNGEHILQSLKRGLAQPPLREGAATNLIVARLRSHAPERDRDRLSTSLHQWHLGFVLRSTPPPLCLPAPTLPSYFFSSDPVRVSRAPE